MKEQEKLAKFFGASVLDWKETNVILSKGISLPKVLNSCGENKNIANLLDMAEIAMSIGSISGNAPSEEDDLCSIYNEDHPHPFYHEAWQGIVGASVIYVPQRYVLLERGKFFPKFFSGIKTKTDEISINDYEKEFWINATEFVIKAEEDSKKPPEEREILVLDKYINGKRERNYKDYKLDKDSSYDWCPPMIDISIPIKDFGEEPISQFLYQKRAKDYGEFLASTETENMKLNNMFDVFYTGHGNERGFKQISQNSFVRPIEGGYNCLYLSQPNDHNGISDNIWLISNEANIPAHFNKITAYTPNQISKVLTELGMSGLEKTILNKLEKTTHSFEGNLKLMK